MSRLNRRNSDPSLRRVLLLTATLLPVLLAGAACGDHSDRAVNFDEIQNTRTAMSKSQAAAAWATLTADPRLEKVVRKNGWVHQAAFHPGSAGRVVIEVDVASTDVDQLVDPHCETATRPFDHVRAIVFQGAVKELRVSSGIWSCAP